MTTALERVRQSSQFIARWTTEQGKPCGQDGSMASSAYLQDLMAKFHYEDSHGRRTGFPWAVLRLPHKLTRIKTVRLFSLCCSN